MLKHLFLAFLTVVVLTSCENNVDTATYNVYFWFPNSSEDKHLGVVNGLAACGSLAHGFAISKNLSRDDGWAYVCCMKTSSSECAEKHR